MTFFWQWNDKSILVERHNGEDFLIMRPTAHELIDYVFRQHGTMGRPRPISELDNAMSERDAAHPTPTGGDDAR